MNHLTSAISVLLANCLTWGCASTSDLRLSSKPDKVTNQLKEQILVGTDVAKGKEIMEHLQFKCDWVANKQFVVWRGHLENKTVYGPMDYLYCTRNIRHFPGSRTYTVVLPFSQGIITNVFVNVKEWGVGDL